MIQELGFVINQVISIMFPTQVIVIGYENGLKDNNCLISITESSKIQVEIRGTLPQLPCIHFRIDKYPGSFNFHHFNSSPQKRKRSSLSAAVGLGSKEEGIIPGKHRPKQGVEKGSLIMDSKFGDTMEYLPSINHHRFCYKLMPR